MIRSTILTAIKANLPEEVKHVALWNHNVEFLEQEDAWPRPAVFVEFASMDMEPTKNSCLRTRSELRLHIVVDYDPNDETAIFKLTDKIYVYLNGLNTDGFSLGYMSRIDTNHNHEDLVEEIATFRYSAEYIISNRPITDGIGAWIIGDNFIIQAS